MITWNGEPVSGEGLKDQLYGNLMLPVEPELVFGPEANAKYDLTLRVLALVKESGATKFCFGELEQYRRLGGGQNAGFVNFLATSYVAEMQIEPRAIDLIEPTANPPSCSPPAKELSVWTN